jgi:hypothetical protein
MPEHMLRMLLVLYGSLGLLLWQLHVLLVPAHTVEHNTGRCGTDCCFAAGSLHCDWVHFSRPSVDLLNGGLAWDWGLEPGRLASACLRMGVDGSLANPGPMVRVQPHLAWVTPRPQAQVW